MNTDLDLYPNSPETQKKITETPKGTVGGVLKVASKTGILCPGAIFEACPRAQNTKLGPKNEHRPRFVPKLTRNYKNLNRNT